MLNTSVHLLKVPFSIDGLHQPFGFGKTAREQASYFRNNYHQSTVSSRVLLDPNDGYFLAHTTYQNAARSNYIMFVNPSYGNKYFYAYITDIKPRSGNEQVEIHYVMDSVQSYMFEWLGNVKEGQVYREHIGKDYKKWVDNTLSEDVPTGKLEAVKVYKDIESDSSLYSEDKLKPLIRWAVFVSSAKPADLDIIDAITTSSGEKPVYGTHYCDFGYKAKSNKIAQTLNYYVVPIRTDMRNNGGDIFINDTRAATVEEISEFFAEDILAVNSLIRVIVKNDIPIDGVKISRTTSGRIDIKVPGITGANLVNIGGREFIEDQDTETWTDKFSKAGKTFFGKIFGSKHPVAEGVVQGGIISYLLPFYPWYRFGKWMDKGEDEKPVVTAGDVLILDDSLELDTDGTVMVQVDNIFKDLHPDEPRLRFPPFTRYYIETENGSEKEFDVTKLDDGEAVLKYRTNLGPIDSSILSLHNYNNRNNTKGSFTDNLQYESFLQYSSDMSIPIETNQTAALLQGKQNQMAASLNASLLDSVTGTMSGATGMVLGASLGPKGYGMAAEGASEIANSITGLYKANAAHEARMNDIKNKPNSVGQIGMDISYNLLNKRANNLIKVKTVSGPYRELALDYIKRNGQQVMRLKKPNLTSRKNWNYVQCELNISGAGIPQKHIDNIRSIFLNGVTLWHTSDIYNYSRSNSMR